MSQLIHPLIHSTGFQNSYHLTSSGKVVVVVVVLGVVVSVVKVVEVVVVVTGRVVVVGAGEQVKLQLPSQHFCSEVRQ